MLFVAAGIAGLADPHIMSAGVSTGIHVHNLDQLGIGTLLVVVVIIIAAITITRTVHQFRRLPTNRDDNGTDPQDDQPDHIPPQPGT